MSDIFRRHTTTGQSDDTSARYSPNAFSVLPWTGDDDAVPHSMVLEQSDEADTSQRPPGTLGSVAAGVGAHAAAPTSLDTPDPTSTNPATAEDDGDDEDSQYDPDAGSDDDFDVHEQYGGRRVSRLTILLSVGLIAAVGFAGGVALQKNHDVGLTSAAAGGGSGRAAAFAAGGSGNGFGGSGFGGSGFGARAGTGSTGTTGGTGTTGTTGTTGGTGAAAAPIVVGTITSVHGTTVTVKDFAGTSVTVIVPPTAAVTTPGLTPLAAGMTASVTGSKSGVTVTAASLTAHRPA